MENQMQIFNNAEFGQVRTEVVNNKVYFCDRDIAKCLGYKNANDALYKHCKKKGIAKCDTLTKGGVQQLKFLLKRHQK